MFHRRKLIERDVLSSHGDATRYFVTFLDNHDVKERIRFVDPNGAAEFDGQVTLAVACLYSLPGVPCLYYGTEQGLHGRGSDPAVREALWGGPGFNEGSTFYSEIQKIEGIAEIHEVMGPYDIVVELTVDSLQEIPPVLGDRIRPIVGIQSTTSLVTFPE